MNLKDLAYDVWKKKYATDNEKNYSDSIDRWIKAIRKENDKNNWKEKDNYYNNLSNALNRGDIIFGGSIMYGLGRDNLKTSLSNCYVLSIEDDSIEGIFNCMRDMSKTYAWRGGVGIDISTLRPKGFKVNNAAQTTTGAVSFMPLFSKTTETIGQFGRRGALMICIEDIHLDVLDFIKSKTELYPNQIEGANISVKVSDKTMQAYKDNDYIDLFFKTKNEEKTERIKAKKLIKDIALHSWRYADPGILFWDHIIRYSPKSVFDESKPIATNPCGELPLGNGSACLLGHINLNNIVEDGNIVYSKLQKNIDLMIRSLDTILQINSHLHPLEIQRKSALNNREIGIGITGVGDMLAKLNVKYGSEESIKILNDVMFHFNKFTYYTSIELAEERGIAPIFENNKDKLDDYLNHMYFENSGLFRDCDWKNRIKNLGGIRNVGISTVAPTGSGSLLLGTTSGIEPLFSAFHIRKVIMGENEERLYPIIHEKLYERMSNEEKEKLNNILNDKSEIKAYQYMNKIKSKYGYIEAHEIDWKDRVNIQSVVQTYIDNAISSTLNLPEEITYNEIEKIYLYAWEKGLKGITVYRNGSRSAILTKPKEIEEEKEVFKPTDLSIEFEKQGHKIIKKNIYVPEKLLAIRHKIKGDGKKWYITISFADGLKCQEPIEIMIKSNDPTEPYYLNKAITAIEHYAYEVGIDEQEINKNIQKYKNQLLIDRIARAINLLLRHNVKLKKVLELLDSPSVGSLLFQIKRVLSSYVIHNTKEICPECGENLVLEEGCVKCIGCGYSKCG